MEFRFRPITPEDAQEIIAWRYDAPYDVGAVRG